MLSGPSLVWQRSQRDRTHHSHVSSLKVPMAVWGRRDTRKYLLLKLPTFLPFTPEAMRIM